MNSVSTEEALFHAALAIQSEPERLHFLSGACAGDSALQQRLLLLLEAHDDRKSLLQTQVPRPGDTQAEIPAVTDRQIGAYHLIEQIGEGGMGVVYVAEQRQPIKRYVALKIIKPGMDSRQVVARFEAERQALALMDHPHIARVFDGGTINERPYFVMELVRGIPITDYCDNERLPIRERLNLFVQVCQAVQHAHQKGIIHRDLKPSNVLVTRQDDTPVPKVIDFGIAKAVNQTLTDKTIYTQFAQLVGTPLYMSPEQAQLSGLDIDTRSDVYSLGVLLYELLTGTTPFLADTLREKGLDEMRRIIREDEPPPPSQRISTLNAPSGSAIFQSRGSDSRRLLHLLQGELDWIVMRALEKDRTRRYSSAADLAEDVERYLLDEPVLACPPSTVYRLGKFARKHKIALSVAGMLLLALVSLGGGIGWLLNNQQTRRTRAETVVVEASTIAEPLLKLSDPQNPQLKAALMRTESQLEAGLLRPEVAQRARQLLADATMLENIQATTELSSYINDRNERSLAEHYQKAFEEYGLDIHQLEPNEAAKSIRDSIISGQLIIALNDWLLIWRRLDPQDQTWKRLLEVLDKADPDPRHVAFRESLNNATNKQALQTLVATTSLDELPSTTLFYLHLWLREHQLMVEAIEVLERAQQRYPTDFGIACELSHMMRGEARPRRFKEAMGYARIAIALRPQSSHAKGLLDIAIVEEQQNHDEPLLSKLAEQEEWKDVLERLEYVAANAPLRFWSLKVVSTFESHAPAELKERFQAACAVVEREAARRRDVWTLCRDKLGAMHDYTQEAHGSYLACLKPDSAEYRSQLQPQLERILRDSSAPVRNALKELLPSELTKEELKGLLDSIPLHELPAATLYELHDAMRDRKAMGLAIDVLRIGVQEYPENFRFNLELAYQLATFAEHPQPKEAIPFGRTAVAIEPKNAHALWVLAHVLVRNDQFEECLILCEQALQIDPSKELASLLIIQALTESGRIDEAMLAAEERMRLKPNSAASHRQLGVVLRRKGRIDEAIANHRIALTLEPDWSGNHGNLSLALRDKGMLEEATASIQKAIELEPTGLDLRFTLALILADKGQLDEAIASYQKVAEKDPARGENSIAWMLANWPDLGRRDPKQAIERAQKAVQLAPAKGSYWGTLGAAQYRAGQWADAVTTLTKAIEIKEAGNGDGSTELFLAMSQWQLKNPEQARLWYDRGAEKVKASTSGLADRRKVERFQMEAEELLGLTSPK